MKTLHVMMALFASVALSLTAKASILDLGYEKVSGGKSYDTGMGISVVVPSGAKRNCQKAGKFSWLDSDFGEGRLYETGYGFKILVKEGERRPAITRPCRKPFDILDGQYGCTTKNYEGRLLNGTVYTGADLDTALDFALSECENALEDVAYCEQTLQCFNPKGDRIAL